jgi:hypothetical protein
MDDTFNGLGRSSMDDDYLERTDKHPTGVTIVQMKEGAVPAQNQGLLAGYGGQSLYVGHYEFQ